MATVTDAEIQELVRSQRGGFGLTSGFTATVVGSGKIYVSYDDPEGDTDEDKITWLKANGIPLSEGQYAEDELIAGDVLFAVADTGSVDVRVTRKGSK